MSIQCRPPLNQSDLSRLDRFLRSNACGKEAMGLSYAHGFLTAIASGPEQLDSAEWLRLVFDEPVFNSGVEGEELLNLALRLFSEIQQSLKNSLGFRPIFDHVRSHSNQIYADAQPWAMGFTDGIKLFAECWTTDANRALKSPLNFIFQLANTQGLPDNRYSKLCDAIPDAAEYIYCFWQAKSHS